jgi:hypothetical protein
MEAEPKQEDLKISKCYGILFFYPPSFLSYTDNQKRVWMTEQLSRNRDMNTFPLKVDMYGRCPFAGNKTYYTMQDLPVVDDCIDITKTSCFIKFEEDKGNGGTQ